MCYAALTSLGNTIHRILNHHLFSITLEEKQQILYLLDHVNSFEGYLEEFPHKFNCLEGRMREQSLEAEDILDFFVLEKVSPSSHGGNKLQLEEVMREINLIAGEVEKIKDSSSSKGVQRGAEAPSRSSSSSAPPIRKDHAVVGFEDYVLHVKERLFNKQSKLEVIPICGMGGIGKTTLAKNVYDDPLVMENFHIRVWVTVSQDYNAMKIFSSLRDSLKVFDKDRLGKTDEEKVYKILKGRKYLVVMDDIWSSDAWDIVRRVFPDDCYGSRVLLTTRLSDVASYPDSSSKLCEMQLMDAKQSWVLFKKKVFSNEKCPSELKNIGKEIARSCKGLPLAIVVIAGILSTANRNLASWLEIGDNVNSTEQNQIEEILSLSYFQLPQCLRPCFLYMGSFLEDDEIKATKLIQLWVAEGLVKSCDNFEKVAEEYLEELVKRNLVLVTKRKYDSRIKSCGLHDLMRDFCIRKALESRFFLNLMDERLEKDSFIECIKNHRRLNVDSSDARHLSSSYNSTIHSIKCSRYDIVELDFLESLRLLRVLDAEPADLETSPSMVKLTELFHLRYLAVRTFPNVRLVLWNLQNLQTLKHHHAFADDIVEEEFDDLWLPWCMPHLRHVYFYGTIWFYDPKGTTCSLESLQTVSYVSHQSCTERILKKIPNLKKLKVDLSSGSHHGRDACLNNLVHLHRLESLELCARRNIQVQPKFCDSIFLKMTLKKLILRNLILPMKDLIVVGWLPNLQVLKLRGCGCLGGSWETTEGEFPQLEFLLIEQFYFTNWITESNHFPRLRRLSLINCHDLDEIPKDIGEIPTLERIEVLGAVKSLLDSAKEIRKEQKDLGNDSLQVICIANWFGHETFDSYEIASDDDNNDD